MSEQGQLKKDKKGSIPDMPCELLDHIASQIDEGKDLISWIKACKLGGVVNLGDLELLAKLPLAIRNVDISLKRYLRLNAKLDHDTLCYWKCVSFLCHNSGWHSLSNGAILSSLFQENRGDS
jgi:hypothetical protein